MSGGPHFNMLVIGLVLWSVCTWSVGMSCNSCGSECQSACGTRNFRTCCFNYLRKRSAGGEEGDGPGLRLELLVVPELAARYWEQQMEAKQAPPVAEADNSDSVPGRMQLVYNA
ncbi:hypothetical protein C0J52_15868 [Blattella germanica]|nr:hypothetical protein C0J52_15868 [Blattella germanica]